MSSPKSVVVREFPIMLSWNGTKKIAKQLLPPFAVGWLREIARRSSFRKRFLEVVPEGWPANPSLSKSEGWNSAGIVAEVERNWQTFLGNLGHPLPLGCLFEDRNGQSCQARSFPHNLHLAFAHYAYVLALAARKKNALSVLDWGGSLGHYFRIAKAVLPDVALNYHCQEVPLFAEAGKRLNPEVHWHIGPSGLNDDYDLVMNISALQYSQDWAGILRRLARAVKAGGFLFLSSLPIVERAASFVVVSREYRCEILYQAFNKNELLQAVASPGLRLVREFMEGAHPYVPCALEQISMRGWLFEKMDSPECQTNL